MNGASVEAGARRYAAIWNRWPSPPVMPVEISRLQSSRGQLAQHRQRGRQDEGQGQGQAGGADGAAPDQRGERVVAGHAAGGDELGGEATGGEQAEHGAGGIQAAAGPDHDDDADEGDAGRHEARQPSRLLQDPGRKRQHQQRREEVDGGGLGLGM